MGRAIDILREALPTCVGLSDCDALLTELHVAAALDEYDAAAATAGRLMAENAELRRTVVGMGDMMAALKEELNAKTPWYYRPDSLAQECRDLTHRVRELERERDYAVKRAEAAEAAVRACQYEACGISMTEAARDAQFPDLTEEP